MVIRNTSKPKGKMESSVTLAALLQDSPQLFSIWKLMIT